MRPVVRSAITAGAVLLTAALGVTVRTLTAYGVFTAIPANTAMDCQAIAAPQGPEDIAIDDASGLVFVSAFDRRAARDGHWSPRDGIYIASLKAPSLRLVRAAGTPTDFHPHGISLVRDAAGLALLAIDHRRGGTASIEVFDVAAPSGGGVSLHALGSIESGMLNSPNAIAAVDRDHFYVANDHGSTTVLGRFLDDVLLLPRANIVYFNGTIFQTVASGLAFPSGLALSRDGRFLYASETYARRLDTFARSPVSGVIENQATLDIPSGLDNVRLDAGDRLWIGSHPKALAMGAFRADPNEPAPSEIFEVRLKDGVPQAAAPAFADDGHRIGGSSIAAVSGRTMLIGGPLDDHVLRCRLE